MYQQEYEEAALRVLRSGWYVLGKEVQMFENEFAAYTGRKFTKRQNFRYYLIKRCIIMKKIEAIIRKTKFQDVKEALLNSNIDWFEYHDVHGIGQSRQERIYRGVQYSTDVIERVKISIVCREMFVESTIKVIMDVAHTGKVGDGRIFLSDMIDCYSIRTGDHGDTVLADKK